jgi:hypothetical protein
MGFDELEETSSSCQSTPLTPKASFNTKKLKKLALRVSGTLILWTPEILGLLLRGKLVKE